MSAKQTGQGSEQPGVFLSDLIANQSVLLGGPASKMAFLTRNSAALLPPVSPVCLRTVCGPICIPRSQRRVSEGMSALQVQQHPSDVSQQGSGEPSDTQAATLQVCYPYCSHVCPGSLYISDCTCAQAHTGLCMQVDRLTSNLNQIAKVVDQAKASAEADGETIRQLQAEAQRLQPSVSPETAQTAVLAATPAAVAAEPSHESQPATSQAHSGQTAALTPTERAISSEQEAVDAVQPSETADAAEPSTEDDADKGAAAEELAALQHRHQVLEADLQTMTAERDVVKQQVVDLQGELKRIQDQSEKWQSRAGDWEKEGRLLQDHVQALQDGAAKVGCRFQCGFLPCVMHPTAAGADPCMDCRLLASCRVPQQHCRQSAKPQPA